MLTPEKKQINLHAYRVAVNESKKLEIELKNRISKKEFFELKTAENK